MLVHCLPPSGLAAALRVCFQGRHVFMFAAHGLRNSMTALAVVQRSRVRAMYCVPMYVMCTAPCGCPRWALNIETRSLRIAKYTKTTKHTESPKNTRPPAPLSILKPPHISYHPAAVARAEAAVANLAAAGRNGP